MRKPVQKNNWMLLVTLATIVILCVFMLVRSGVALSKIKMFQEEQKKAEQIKNLSNEKISYLTEIKDLIEEKKVIQEKLSAVEKRIETHDKKIKELETKINTIIGIPTQVDQVSKI